MRYWIIMFIFTLVNINLIGQIRLQPQITLTEEIECDTDPTQTQIDLMNITRSIRENMNFNTNNFRAEPIEIKIKAHVIRQSPATSLAISDIEADEVDASISQASSQFNQLGISFERDGNINYIYETPGGPDIYPVLNRSSTDAANLATTHYVDGAINLFFVRGLVNDSGDICGNASLPGSSTKRIFLDTGYSTLGTPALSDDTEVAVSSSCALNGSSLAHEIGHYFFLYHTHQGISGGLGIIADELPDGSNCGYNVGDEICDTPADPNLNGCVNPADCSYVITASCPSTYSPDIANIMSSSIKSCRTNFTNGQIDRMIKSLILDRPELLDSSVDCPVFTGYDDMHTHNAGTPVETTEASGTIVSEATVEGESMFEANDGANVIYSASDYISLYPSFEAEYTSTFLAHIEGCELATNLKTAGTVSLNTNIRGLNVQPNPFRDYANIEFDLAEDSRLTIGLFDMLGNHVQALTNSKSYESGKHLIPVNGTNLPAGIYYCTIQAGNHIETQKMVLTK